MRSFWYCLCSESFEEIYKSEVYSLRVLLGGISWGLGRVSLGEETRSQRMKTDQQYAQKFYPFLNEFLPFLSFNLQVYCDINTFILLCGLWRSYNKWTFFSVVEFFQKVAMEDISNSDMLVKRLNLHKINSSLSRDWPLRNWFTDWPLSTDWLIHSLVAITIGDAGEGVSRWASGTLDGLFVGFCDPVSLLLPL